ncbi:ribonuclease domain-containing protein [Streptomyces alkaliterrae]|uniref:Ribonuclease N n=2 Tax=Streptomyces alkaliterrae TaxID=2213162 RepID=A0A7W3WGX0_9ACTN|nr:ribonuclease domain-containing protein [Streptomyces alkaliterrae]MBB1252089.1 ribonuclease N [Streptomyces alkaliterrae]MBB1260798.1 ribonuclease N [Streptomyces alkaliterrae]
MLRRILLALVAALALLLTGCGADTPTTGNPSDPTATPGVTATPEWAEGMPLLTPGELPAEARETLRLIEADGPFPYAKDGSVFGNYERRLPLQARGYYREYTVPTPGARNRGARRIVTGDEGERYYTSDHYESFKAVVNP